MASSHNRILSKYLLYSIPFFLFNYPSPPQNLFPQPAIPSREGAEARQTRG